MKSDIVIIGGGAAGLMAAWSAARTLVDAGSDASVSVLEKMPRPGRKIMITGKGRCNFSNIKDWNEFSTHIRSKSNLVKSSFYNFTPQDVLDFFESNGMETVVERGDRAFPASHRASDVVDALVRACHGVGVKIETEAEVSSIDLGQKSPSVGNSCPGRLFTIKTSDGRSWVCRKLILATGGLSYPNTGSTGDGYRFAQSLGHSITPLFPSLTALVPRGYKQIIHQANTPEEVSHSLDPTIPLRCMVPPLTAPRVARPSGVLPEDDEQHHIDRSTPLSETGKLLCGIQLKNVGVQLLVEGTVAESEFGDIDFTDGGIEGPIGFQVSRKAVKSLINGSRVSLVMDLKPGVALTELTARIKELWVEVDRDPRSRRLHEKEKCRILLGKLMPWELIPAFKAMHPEIMTLERRSRTESKLWVNLPSIAKALKEWKFDIEGYVGYERAVVTAGGVSADEVVAKTLESRIVPGLYFCGEVLDLDSDTGGYNLQIAFSTGRLAGQNAAKTL